MNVERLRQLASLLRADAANPTGVKFDLGVWAAPGDPTQDGSTTHYEFDQPLPKQDVTSLDGAKVKPIPMTCNTFACALGLAAIYPEFQKQGLNYTFLYGGPDAMIGAMIPTFEGDTGWNAGAKFFDIAQDDSRYFFDPDCYDSVPREAEGELFVAQRIENFIDGIIDADQHPAHGRDDDDVGDWDDDD